MKIDRIEIERSRVSPHERVLTIECGGKTFQGYFDDMHAFARAVVGALTFFGQHAGLIKVDTATGKVTTLVKR